MIHLGDITKIRGCTAPVVDCIIGGSPCQDLSIAGKRAGLAGERSGLYMEQIRIIKEMREHDRANGRSGEFIRPRFMVWENVPGAFSSNKGKDFAAVLEEAVKIAEPEAPPVPMPQKGWPTSGCLMGDGWSVAWRVLDAQFWGVPQRRRRIALVADFGGATAPEILFVRKSLSGHFEPGRAEREGTSSGAEKSTGNPVYCLQGNGIDRADTAGCNGRGWTENVSYTMNTIDRPAVLDMSHACDVIRDCGDIVPSLRARMGTGGNNVPLCYGIGNGQVNGAVNIQPEMSRTLSTMHDAQGVLLPDMTPRRLTPLECERLQGFPDGWTDIGEWVDSKGKTRKTTDSARYKALGNSIALPPWKWVLKRLCAQYERDATMASLFDGISGFCVIWAQLNGIDSIKFTSEIEEFPMAVCKKHFGNEETGQKGDFHEAILGRNKG